MPDEKDPAIVFLPRVRLSFPHLFTAHAMPSNDGKPQKPAFSATFLFDNDEHGPLLDKIDALIERMALDEFRKKIGFKKCLRDGNEKCELDGYGDGTSFIAARSQTRPLVVNRDRSPITEEDGIIYAGCYVNATIRLWVQNNQYGKRVNAQLRGVQFLEDGESFGAGAVDAEKEFEAIDAEHAPREDGTQRSGRSRSSLPPPRSGRSGRSSGEEITMDDF